jgi:hypothetical protein
MKIETQNATFEDSRLNLTDSKRDGILSKPIKADFDKRDDLMMKS